METVLAKPLSGTEVAEAICYDLKQALLHEDRLAPHTAHPRFSYTLSLHVNTPDGPTASVVRTLAGGEAAPCVPGAPGTATTEVTVERPVAPPNAVRQETEQPIPVLVETEKGKIEEKWVKYAKDGDKAKPKPPRNKVVGGEA